MEIERTIAENVRALRTNRGLTLEEASKLTGVSRSMLAQIEKGASNPTISVLWKIANGYKIPFSSLLETSIDDVEIVRAANCEPLINEGGYVNTPAFVYKDGRNFETYRIHIEPNGRLDAEPHFTGTEEFITVFAGTLEITIDGELHALGTGDSIRFEADVSHSYANVGKVATELSMILSYK